MTLCQKRLLETNSLKPDVQIILNGEQVEIQKTVPYFKVSHQSAVKELKINSKPPSG
jgi:hypothetical protein